MEVNEIFHFFLHWLVGAGVVLKFSAGDAHILSSQFPDNLHSKTHT